MNARFRHRCGLAGLVTLLASLAACGGGSSGGPAATPPPPEPAAAPAPVFDTAEFRRNAGLDLIDALPAFEAGLSGAGVTVGVIDSGIDLDHADLDANISPDSINIRTGTMSDAQDIDGHGTAVAGIIAAERNDQGAHGVAFDARLLAVRADDPSTCDGEDGCSFSEFDIAAGIDHAVAHGARVINLSLGSDGGPGFRLAQSLRRAADAGAVIVISAGNEQLAMPVGLAAFAADPAMRGRMVIAGAVDDTKAMASFSNRAGGPDTRAVFVVAPGVGILTTNLGSPPNVMARASGTSFSAPHVSGALAVLMQNFPNLPAEDIVAILLETAEDLGTAGTDAVFGRGLIDLAAAIQPSGPLMVETADGGTAELGGGLAPGGAMGDSLTAAFAGALATDGRNRAYKAFLDDRVAAPRARFHLASAAGHLRRDSASLALGRHRVHLGFNSGTPFAPVAATPLERQAATARIRTTVDYSVPVSARLSLRMATGRAAGAVSGMAPGFARTALSNNDTSPVAQIAGRGQVGGLTYHPDGTTAIGIAAFAGERETGGALDDTEQRGAAVTLARNFAADTAIGVTAGRMRETNAVLGMTGTGVLDLTSGADTDFLQVEARLGLGAWTFYGGASISRSRADASGGGVIADFGTLWADSRSLVAVNDALADRGHRFGLSLFQPLAITSGHADAVLTTAGPNGVIAPETRRIALTPKARETAIELFHEFDMPGAARLRSHFVYRANPDNVGAAADEAAVFVRFETPL